MNQEFGAIQGRESSHAAQGQGTKGVATTSDSAKYIKHLCENVNHDVIKLSHVVRKCGRERGCDGVAPPDEWAESLAS